jgi:o-succinylbenzoate synthase
MFKASVEKYVLDFKRPSGTSRGVLTQKDSWFIRIWETENPAIVGIGEASIIQNLSPEWDENYEDFLEVVVKNINEYVNEGCEALLAYPSIYFAIETALLDLKNGGEGVVFPSDFVTNQTPIAINGLIWMGSKEYMFEQINEKIEEGYSCLKLKIGAIDFSSELDLLAFIRSKFSKDQLELRVDANGAFSPKNALYQLNELAQFDLHSIEQPIKQGQLTEMADLCAKTPVPIALDEELIGVHTKNEKETLLRKINPHYIILKPSLIGGFRGSDEWIELAESLNIDWWITSALESNIGLNAIAQYTFIKNNPLPQGLGTGQLYTNNIPSGLTILEGKLFLKKKIQCK